MKKNILLINVCKERFHALEFVEPIKDIIKTLELDFFEKKYFEVTEEDLIRATHVIICGTSIKDDEFLKDINKFSWIKNFSKSLLGICVGMQIISLIFGSKVKKKTEIGFYNENFTMPFLGIKGTQEVYHLHHNYCVLPTGFIEFTKSEVPQAIKHKNKQVYGVLFHPEVRQKEMIFDFCKL